MIRSSWWSYLRGKCLLPVQLWACVGEAFANYQMDTKDSSLSPSKRSTGNTCKPNWPCLAVVATPASHPHHKPQFRCSVLKQSSRQMSACVESEVLPRFAHGLLQASKIVYTPAPVPGVIGGPSGICPRPGLYTQEAVDVANCVPLSWAHLPENELVTNVHQRWLPCNEV